MITQWLTKWSLGCAIGALGLLGATGSVSAGGSCGYRSAYHRPAYYRPAYHHRHHGYYRPAYYHHYAPACYPRSHAYYEAPVYVSAPAYVEPAYYAPVYRTAYVARPYYHGGYYRPYSSCYPSNGVSFGFSTGPYGRSFGFSYRH